MKDKFGGRAKQDNFVRVNTRIRAPKIRLIDAEGNQVGVVGVPEGLKMAEEASLDLVEISPNSNPPVCRILDYGKYVYNLKKKEKESKKKQKTTDVKEVKISAKIEEHDYQTKLRNARRFIGRGDKVKLSLFFRGREMAHTELGEEIINRFIEDMSDITEVERNSGLEGRSIQVYLTPMSNAKKRAATKSGDEE